MPTRSVIALFCFLAFISGCSSEPGRGAIGGKVTLDGQPLARGTIRFLPAGDTQGPMAATEIIAGSYALDEVVGPVVGNHRVEILADESDQLPYDIMDPAEYQKHGAFPRPRQPIPPRYNKSSTLTATIVADESNTADFALFSKP
jgi:hypothetical protein